MTKRIRHQPYSRSVSATAVIVRRYTCSGCEEPVVVKSIVMPFGPAKGERQELDCGCRCPDPELEKSVRRNQQARKKQRSLDLFAEESLVNADMTRCTFDNYVPRHQSQADAKKNTILYTRTFSLAEPRNLLMTGSYGLGKSHLAMACAHSLLERGYSAIFINVTKLLTRLKATYGKKGGRGEADILAILEQVDCLVLDDIGAEHGTEQSGSWSMSKVFEVVDSRLGKHTIFTTNLDGRELSRKAGPRTFSRMMQETEVVPVFGEDYRLERYRNQQRKDGKYNVNH
ncbi:ATP-binding protein [Bacillus piscicola]|uniref:ATP-binding protein n=1 Tax=Bacillus piscicola TaxID=1632684 RepID=UPI001F097D35|nr:ATP-binding protein [Bacillus piscicola]